MNDSLIEPAPALSEWVILRNARGQWIASMSREVYEAIYGVCQQPPHAVTAMAPPAQLTSRLSRD